MLPAEGHLLRVYIGEKDKKEGMPLYEWIIKAARTHGIAGATVFRGMQGYGAHTKIHSARLLDMSSDLPILIEIVDTLEKIETLMPLLDEAITEGLATIEKVQIRFYRPGIKS